MPTAIRLQSGRIIAEMAEVRMLKIKPVAAMSVPMAKLRTLCQPSTAGAQNAKMTPTTKTHSEQIDIFKSVGIMFIHLAYRQAWLSENGRALRWRMSGRTDGRNRNASRLGVTCRAFGCLGLRDFDKCNNGVRVYPCCVSLFVFYDFPWIIF